jgi:hypothetical protein
MLFSLLAKGVFAILFIIGIGLTQIAAQDAKTTFVAKGVFWFDKDSATEVYFFPNKNDRGYRLAVVSPKEVKVKYHTEINSYEPVDKDLTVTENLGAVKYFEFDHHFSKMTIWMALEFTIDGRKIPALTRTFYDNIFETVETEKYFNPLKKKTN